MCLKIKCYHNLDCLSFILWPRLDHVLLSISVSPERLSFTDAWLQMFLFHPKQKTGSNNNLSIWDFSPSMFLINNWTWHSGSPKLHISLGAGHHAASCFHFLFAWLVCTCPDTLRNLLSRSSFGPGVGSLRAVYGPRDHLIRPSR